MDWQKLQHTLYNLDPTDPAEDLVKLQAEAGKPAGNIAATKDYVTESVDVPKGSMPIGVDSISDFAALAGIQLDETQKHGDYAKAKAPWPKAKAGRTAHPLKDKLVGEEDLDELDVVDRFKQGYNNYNTPAALKNPNKSTNDSGKEKPSRVQGGNDKTIAALLGMDERFVQSFRKAKTGQTLSPTDNHRLAAAFLAIVKAEPQALQKIATEFRKVKGAPAESTKRTESIKEELLRKLNAKK
jgi:hypothetical protein